MRASSTRSPPSTSAASGRSPAAAISTGIHPRGHCRPAHRRSARNSAGCPTRSNAPPNSTPPMAAIPISTGCRCTASCSRSRIRSTPRTCAPPAGGDAAYDIDFPARDHGLVEQLRDKGAIIFAKAVCTEYNGRAGDPGGRHQPEKILPSVLGYQRSTWAGNPANPYDTTRAASLGSSSGSALSVRANLVMCEPRRGDPRIVPRTGQPQRRGADPAAQGDARLQWRSDRRRHLLRPRRHPLPDDRRLRQGARRAEGPGRRLLRSARSLHDRAALLGAGDALCEPRRDVRRRRVRSKACASASSASRCWSARRQGRPRRSLPPLRPRSKRCSASGSARRLVESSDPLWQPIPSSKR